MSFGRSRSILRKFSFLIPSILIILVVDFDPRIMLTFEVGIPKVLETSLMIALFAFPLAGGSFTWTFRTRSSSSSINERELLVLAITSTSTYIISNLKWIIAHETIQVVDSRYILNTSSIINIAKVTMDFYIKDMVFYNLSKQGVKKLERNKRWKTLKIKIQVRGAKGLWRLLHKPGSRSLNPLRHRILGFQENHRELVSLLENQPNPAWYHRACHGYHRSP